VRAWLRDASDGAPTSEQEAALARACEDCVHGVRAGNGGALPTVDHLLRALHRLLPTTAPWSEALMRVTSAAEGAFFRYEGFSLVWR
jgi:hypothetical protein